MSISTEQPVVETENLPLPNGSWVIAHGKGFRLYRPARPDASRFSAHLLQTGDSGYTRQLLSGALLAGMRSLGGDKDAKIEAPQPSLNRHIYSLAGSYQTTHATPPTMRAVAKRFQAIGNDAVAHHCLHVADEEDGHDRLALKDLESLGIRALDFVTAVRPTNAMRLVELFTRLANSPHPIATLGYAYGLERMALFQTSDAVTAVEATIPAGVMATRCLRVHSAVGTDNRHVTESIDFIARLDSADRAHIATAVFETAALLVAPDDYPGDEALLEMMAPFRT